MSVSKEVVALLAQDRRMQSIKEYTERALQNPDLTHGEKIKLVALNQDDRLTIIKSVQKHTHDYLFMKYPDTFYTTAYHYDWWIFPMHVPAAWRWPQRNYDASINPDEAKTLLSDSKFVEIYMHSVDMYINALELHGWNNYPVRYARMLHSLALFIDAASTVAGLEATYVQLSAHGQHAIAYAKENVVPSSRHYDLLNHGLHATELAVNKCVATTDALHHRALPGK